MITINRALVRQLRTALRKAGIYQQRASGNPPVAFIAGPDGLYIRAKSHLAALEYRQAQSAPVETIWVPAEFLYDCEGTMAEPVSLETLPDGHVKVEFRDKNIPQLIRYDAVAETDRESGFPVLPSELSDNEPGLLPALVAAAETADAESSRYALGNMQISGPSGIVEATDGRQFLRQGGFSFPWKSNVLVPASKFFTFAGLATNQTVEVGKSDNWAVFRVASWTIWLPIDIAGRYPTTADLVPSIAATKSSCRLSASDADFLARSIDALPGDQGTANSVTLDLNGHVTVRSKASDQPEPTEIILTSSTASGEPIRIGVPRHYLTRAVRLGLRDFHFYGEEVPALCRDERRSYVWAAVSNGVVQPSPNAIRIESQAEAAVASASAPTITHKEAPVSTTKPETSSPTEATPSARKRRRIPAEGQTVSNLSPIEQAKAIRATLRQALVQNSEIIRALTRQQRQARLVASTLDSLKQLKVA
ncbi:MAG TPA: hypothetical protein VHC22_01990 [Pirellulales bacterium]|nr:hypothetical protein [Pirellulales bacterium]